MPLLFLKNVIDNKLFLDNSIVELDFDDYDNDLKNKIVSRNVIPIEMSLFHKDWKRWKRLLHINIRLVKISRKLRNIKLFII